MDNQMMADSPVAERFDRLAGMAALASAAIALVYTVAFVILANALLASLALLAGSLLSAVALFAVFERVRRAGSIARLGLIFGLAGVLGAAVHGAYDLAVVIHPEAAGPDGGPFPVDPRGFLTFGMAGLGVLLLSWAGLSFAGLARNLLYLGVLLGVMLVLIYLSRLIVLDPKSYLVLGPAALGAVVSVIWYGWLGWLLLKRTA
jgi:hypothetical protein